MTLAGVSLKTKGILPDVSKATFPTSRSVSPLSDAPLTARLPVTSIWTGPGAVVEANVHPHAGLKSQRHEAQRAQRQQEIPLRQVDHFDLVVVPHHFEHAHGVAERYGAPKLAAPNPLPASGAAAETSVAPLQSWGGSDAPEARTVQDSAVRQPKAAEAEDGSV
eukprot:scaffold655_cov225-Pinguiococcus_pyrenoidosus.AAC.6